MKVQYIQSITSNKYIIKIILWRKRTFITKNNPT